MPPALHMGLGEPATEQLEVRPLHPAEGERGQHVIFCRLTGSSDVMLMKQMPSGKGPSYIRRSPAATCTGQ